MSGHYSFKVIDSIDNTMYNTTLAEQKILKENLRYKPKYRFGGYTECLQNYVDIKKYIAAQGQKP